MTDLTKDHVGLTDPLDSRRYFRKFDAITRHMGRVAAVMQAEDRLSKTDVEVITRYVVALGFTFKALSMKYLMVGREDEQVFGSLDMDSRESGFPVHSELMQMASDAAQAEKHLAGMPDAQGYKEQMVRQIVGERRVPVKLQFGLSQRLYYEELLKGELFWPQNDPDTIWLGNISDQRRKFLVHWAVYDSQINVPVVYLMEVEDSGETALPLDQYRWPEVQAHLAGQALAGLKLLTIAKGFDTSFDDLHPKRLRRFHLGPMYSSRYTRQTGPLRAVLAEARAPEGEDWALAWTEEVLESERVELEKTGWFSKAEREVFALDPFAGRGAETGATRMERAIILPQRPFQVLEEKSPPGFAAVRKFVVGAGGRVLSM